MQSYSGVTALVDEICRAPATTPTQAKATGFRQQATIAACLQAELAFYGQVFGFEVSG